MKRAVLIFVVICVVQYDYTAWGSVESDDSAVEGDNFFLTGYYEGECSPGGPIPMCYGNPCAGVTCDQYPAAVCKVNVCGQCKQIWFDQNDNKIAACKTD